MAARDIIVIGASSGGVQALTTIVRGLPTDLPAAVFVVLHVSHQMPSLLASILHRSGPLPATEAADGDKIERGRIYVAAPDFHLLVNRGVVRVVHGPRENRHRPAVDPLFRSAAVAYGPRVVGVVLSGALDDGTAGMRAVKMGRGISIVQDPADAVSRGMPQSVIDNVEVDYRLRAVEIPEVLTYLAREPTDQGAFVMPDEIEAEVQIAEQQLSPTELREKLEGIASLTTLTCPDCHGNLWRLNDDRQLRFRCHVGHAFTAKSLVVDQSGSLESALWSGLRALEERVMLMRTMAQRSRERKQMALALRFE